MSEHGTPEVPLVLDDQLEVTAGRHEGRRATPVSLESVEPEPTFLVEFTDGSDAVLSASELRVVGPAG